MLRGLLRLVLVLVILVGVAGFFLGWWGRAASPAGGAGAPHGVNTERARDAGAEVGEKAAEAANRAGAVIGDAALTAKIKSKMALDDTVRARAIDVTTSGGVVTVSGTVRSEAEKTRALQLARETSGISRVIDHLRVAR
ncbi:MAG TPA: BON domain-containing protein [Vicinamibacterales bacterium]|nr:BON domain-containing protein [Vicinamibacterales bacterium]